jgi:hypothetical protein
MIIGYKDERTLSETNLAYLPYNLRLQASPPSAHYRPARGAITAKG